MRKTIGDDGSTPRYWLTVFWKRWVAEHLPMIRRRQRHIQPKRDYRKNDIVIVADFNTKSVETGKSN